MSGICGAALAACFCAKAEGHVEQGDPVHVCGAEGIRECQGRWKGEPGTPELTVLSLPFPPPPSMYEHYGVEPGNEEELLRIASEELRPPTTFPFRAKRGGIRYTPKEES